MDYTPEQRTAVFNHQQNLIVVAGAGSGKTRVLVERYLALLDAHPEWPLNALVAITFTKKAAGEMRDRVRRGLEIRLQGVTSPAERQRWAGLLAQMDSARIDTIHGLCATILRANAAEARIDPDFIVLDETEAALLLESVIDDVLAQIVMHNDPVVALFAEYEQRLVRSVLANKALLDAEWNAPVGDLFEQWRLQWAQEAAAEVERFKAEAERIGTIIPPEIDDPLAHGWQVCAQCLDSLYAPGEIDDYLSALYAIGEISLKGGSTKKWGVDKEILDEFRGQLRAIREAVRLALKAIGQPPGEVDRHAARLLPLWSDLLLRVRESYQQIKNEQGMLDFDDLERLTLDLLTAYPHVRTRYRDAEFRHLLVDEFQDTNKRQWGIIQALADVHKGGSLFVVGDPKQSIYAFRGADVSVFEAVQGQVVRAGGMAVAMACSFRTHGPLVNCFNAVFEKLLVRDANSPVREFEVTLGEAMSAHRAAPPSSAPTFELLLIDRQENGTPKDGEKLSAEERRQWEAAEIARRLHELVAEGYLVYDRENNECRPVRYDDIAILFQAMTSVALYEEVFKAAELPFVTIAGRGYYDRQEVWDLLNLLRALYNPEDNLALAAALHSPLFNLSDDCLLALRLRSTEGGRLWDALADGGDIPLDEQEALGFAHQTLTALRRIAGRVTIAELLRTALAHTGYLAVLTGLPDGARRRGNVEKLVDLAQSAGKVTLGAFTRYLDDLSSAEVREGEALVEASGAVTLMTVHASKGLEFPVIVIADASRQTGSRNRDALTIDSTGGLACKVYPPEAQEDEAFRLAVPYNFQRAEYLAKLKEEAEGKRRLYVAMTRAQDYLMISGQGTLENGASGWLGQLLEVLELEDQEPVEVGETARLYAYAWGTLRVVQPVRRPSVESLDAENALAGWEVLRVRSGSAPPGDATPPALLERVAMQQRAAARHLAATQLADMGGARYAANQDERLFYQERVRRKLLHDAPAYVHQVSERRNGTSGRQVGEIVHKALRYWRFPHEADNLEGLLRNYAWGLGIVDETRLMNAVRSAQRLLQAMLRSEIYAWISEAHQAGRAVYHELPFVYRTETRIIHGIIDVLFQRADQSWCIVDYKTNTVGTAAQAPSAAEFVDHARRYYLQVGVYAAAVLAELGGVTPRVFIHYVRYSGLPGSTVEISSDQWREALESLEYFIGNVFTSEEDY